MMCVFYVFPQHFFFYNWTCNWSALPSSLLGNLGPRRRNCEDSSGHKDTQWKHRTKSQCGVYGCELFTIKPYFTFYHHLKNKNAREWIYWKCPFHQQCKTNNRHNAIISGKYVHFCMFKVSMKITNWFMLLLLRLYGLWFDTWTSC